MTTVVVDILLWSTIAFWLLIWTPTAVYLFSLYYKNRNNLAIRRRYYQIVLIIGIIFLYAFSIDRPIALIDDANVFPNSAILHTIHYISFPIQIHGVKLALVWRYFAIYFDMHFIKAMSDSKWKSIISDSYDQSNWFLSHKKTYGNFSFQLKRYIMSWLVLAVFSTIIRNSYQFHGIDYSEFVAQILHGIILFAYAPILIYLYTKMPTINNTFYIKVEMQYITLIFLSQFIVYLISILLHSFFDVSNFTLQYIWSLSGTIAVSLYVYIFTLWTLQKCVWTIEEKELPLSLDLNIISSLSHSYNSNQTYRSRNSLPAMSPTTGNISTHQSCKSVPAISIHQKSQEMDLFETLKDSNGYEFFMTHLMYEMSHECLLSFTEMVTFKNAMKAKLTSFLRVYGLPVSTGNGKTIKDILLFSFPEIVPMSSIVSVSGVSVEESDTRFKEIIVSEFKKKAYFLFVKYIFDPNKTCEYEINISFAMRDPLIGMLKNYENWMERDVNERELFCLFDECIIEMYDLMSDSFLRFKKTPKFTEFVLKNI